MFPCRSKHASERPQRSASIAGPPSPEKNPLLPVPAIVVMMPETRSTLRIRFSWLSRMYRFPSGSMRGFGNPHNFAAVAGPPSPVCPTAPVPAIVVMMPEVSTFRIRALWSPMYRLPAMSRSMPHGCFKLAAVAGPPSPEAPNSPLPATVVMIPDASTLRIRLLSLSRMYRQPEESMQRPHPYFQANAARVAGPPSPEKPRSPVPATVAMSQPSAASPREEAITSNAVATNQADLHFMLHLRVANASVSRRAEYNGARDAPSSSFSWMAKDAGSRPGGTQN